MKIYGEVIFSGKIFNSLKVTGDHVCNVIVFPCYTDGCEM